MRLKAPAAKRIVASRNRSSALVSAISAARASCVRCWSLGLLCIDHILAESSAGGGITPNVPNHPPQTTSNTKPIIFRWSGALGLLCRCNFHWLSWVLCVKCIRVIHFQKSPYSSDGLKPYCQGVQHTSLSKLNF